MEQEHKITIPNQFGTPIAELAVPEDWNSGTKPPRPGYLWISKFYISDRDERVGVCLRDPAKKTYNYLSAQQNPLLQLLRRPAHELNEEEFLSVHLLLEQVGWPGRFRRDWARTVAHGETNVLEVQGLWLQENTKSRGLIVDTTFDSGNYVQEVWFVAPPELFDEYALEADRIFSSFEWKVTADQMKEMAGSKA